MEKETERESETGASGLKKKKKKIEKKGQTERLRMFMLLFGCLPGQDDHHGVEVNRTVCDSLQDKLFI